MARRETCDVPEKSLRDQGLRCGGYRSRTDDLLHAMQALYQLS